MEQDGFPLAAAQFIGLHCHLLPEMDSNGGGTRRPGQSGPFARPTAIGPGQDVKSYSSIPALHVPVPLRTPAQASALAVPTYASQGGWDARDGVFGVVRGFGSSGTYLTRLTVLILT
eukprot:1380019-Amorphochlora_amoeboformis.AAC.2